MAQLTGKWKTIADDIDAVFKKHGMQRRNFRVSTGEFESHLTITVLGSKTGETVDPFAKPASAYTAYHAIFGFKPGWLGMEFEYGGERFKFKGFAMNRPKNRCVIQKIKTGKAHVAPEGPIKFALQQAAINAPRGIAEELIEG